MIAVAAVALLAEATAFAPPLGVPITYVVSETRDEGKGPARHAITRRATFAEAPGGFVAAVETLAIAGAGESGRRFAQSAAPFRGRTLRISLDRDGHVTGVAGYEGLWQRLVAATVASQSGRERTTSPGRLALSRKLLADLRATPPAMQVALLGDAIEPLIGIAALRIGPFPRRAVSQPVRQADGGSATLTGMEDAARVGDLLTVSRDVAGVVAGAALRRTTRLTVAASTGLVAARQETIETALDGRRWTIVRATERR